jgi:hypothetical protein
LKIMGHHGNTPLPTALTGRTKTNKNTNLYLRQR